MLRLWRSDAMLKHSDVARFTRSDAMFANNTCVAHIISVSDIITAGNITCREANITPPIENTACIKSGVFYWRKRWDSNPRALADYRISSVVGYWFIVVNIAHYRLFGTRRKRRHYCH